ncbi:MAG: serine protease [Pseudomonadota bacterium]
MKIENYISITTCESLVNHENGFILKPVNGQNAELFTISDPFGLRKAIVPVLLAGNDQIMRGMGTAFHIDSWGTFITADHVVHISDPNFYLPNSITAISNEFMPDLLLGIGVVFGTVGVPSEAIAKISTVQSLITEKYDPLALIRGKQEFEAAIDIAFLHSLHPIPNLMNRTLPLSSLIQLPAVGDTVVAIGYPDLKCEAVSDDNLRYLLEDGMSAAYGKIIDIHPNGRGSNTPIFEVEANWPSGMSGGPVFNTNGQVIGIVSKSIEPLDGLPGNGSAVSFGCLPKLINWLPSIDFCNPGWRKGWAILINGQFNLTRFYKTLADANAALITQEPESIIAYCANRIGTDEFMQLSKT